MKLYLIPFSLFILFAITWAENLTGGAYDLAAHYVLLKKIVIDKSVFTGYNLNLDEMMGYPPGAHYVASWINIIVKNLIVSLNVLNIFSLVAIYTCLSLFTDKFSGFAKLIFIIIVGYIFLVDRNIPVIGLEIVKGNFLFGQLFGTAILISFVVLYDKYINNIENIIWVFGVYFLMLFVHATPASIFAATVIIKFVLQINLKSKENYKDILLISLIAFVFALLFYFHPYTKFSGEMRLHNGYILFDLLTNGPDDISRYGVLYIILNLLIAIVLLVGWLTNKIKRDKNIEVMYSLYIGISMLTFLYFLMFKIGLVSPYIPKKNFFILGTVSYLLISIASANFIRYFIPKIELIKITKSQLFLILLPVVLVPIFSQTQESPRYLFEKINQVNEVKTYIDKNNIYSHNVISDISDLRMEYNWLISLAELETPKKSRLTDAIVNENLNLLPDDNYVIGYTRAGELSIKDFPKGLSLYSKEQYLQRPLLYPGDVIYLNKKNKNIKRYLVSGFTFPEEWGTWTDGESSRLIFALPHDYNKLQLNLNLKSWLFGDHKSFTVDINCNGNLVKKLQINSRNEQKVEIPINNHKCNYNKNIDIEFIYNSVTSPFAQGESADKRNLGLGIISMQLIN